MSTRESCILENSRATIPLPPAAEVAAVSVMALKLQASIVAFESCITRAKFANLTQGLFSIKPDYTLSDHFRLSWVQVI